MLYDNSRPRDEGRDPAADDGHFTSKWARSLVWTVVLLLAAFPFPWWW
jgi:hypothetical protein